MQPGQFLLRLGWLGTYVQTQHDDFADVVGQGNIPIVHDQDLVVTEARLSLDIGLTRRFSASLMLPMRVVSTSIVYRNGPGDPVQLVEPSTHHRNETLSGIADPMVLGAYTRTLAGTRLTARAGLTVPLGRTEEDPFTLGDMGVQHQHIQMGTGTVNPVFALEASRGFGPWRLGGFAFTQQIVYENAKGYQGGDRYAVGLSLRRALGQRWSVRGGPELQAETAERWNGIRHTEEGNQGRIDVMLAGAVTWTAVPRLTVDLAVKIPMYTHVVGGQLDWPAIVEVGAAWSFGGSVAREKEEHAHEGEHDHDHEHGEGEHGHEHGAGEHDEHAHGEGGHGHGDEHVLDTSGADVADVGKNGERVDLVPVPGKLTIFDFWAEWCQPCKTLEPVLVELARAHPDRVALRRVEVIDWDSPVAAQHLTPGGFDLPHLEIYDASGTRVLEQSSAPGKLAALIETVRGLVEAAAPVKAAPPDKTPVPQKKAMTAPAKPLRIAIEVTDKGFVPRDVEVPRGRPVVLRFVRKAAKTCATEVVLEHRGKPVVKDLPLDTPVELALTFDTPGTIEYGCAMNKMIGGTITVR